MAKEKTEFEILANTLKAMAKQCTAKVKGGRAALMAVFIDRISTNAYASDGYKIAILDMYDHMDPAEINELAFYADMQAIEFTNGFALVSAKKKGNFRQELWQRPRLCGHQEVRLPERHEHSPEGRRPQARNQHSREFLAERSCRNRQNRDGRTAEHVLLGNREAVWRKGMLHSRCLLQGAPCRRDAVSHSGTVPRRDAKPWSLFRCNPLGTEHRSMRKL